MDFFKLKNKIYSTLNMYYGYKLCEFIVAFNCYDKLYYVYQDQLSKYCRCLSFTKYVDDCAYKISSCTFYTYRYKPLMCICDFYCPSITKIFTTIYFSLLSLSTKCKVDSIPIP